MNTSLSKREVNRRRWFERVTEWKQSGQSQKSYCTQHHLGWSTFQRWHRIFTTEQAFQETKPVTFLPVSVSACQATQLNIVLDNNLRIEISSGFDPNMLKEVLQVLQTR